MLTHLRTAGRASLTCLTSPMDLLSRVRRTIRLHNLAGSSTRVVVALSGGPDSMALLHVLRQLDAAGELRVAGVAHFNHRLRAEADADARFCEDAAASFGWRIEIESGDVAARARAEKRSMEDAARASRYECFARALAHFAADVVALGHTRDDQAETFLLRLIRGAGSRGLAAMHPQRGAFIRPLIECRRGELRAWLDEHRIGYLTDESNADVSIPRNRVRAELLPLLEERFNPSIVDALADEAELAREEWQWLEESAAALAARIVANEGTTWRIDREALNAAPPALARLVMHRAMTSASRGRAIAFHHVAAALEVSRHGGPPTDAPGQRVERVGQFVVLTGRPEGTAGRWSPGPDAPNLFRYPLSIPGEVQLAESGCVVSAEWTDAPHTQTADVRRMALIRKDRVGALAVRNRRPGDRFRPAGLQGRKKLQDYFVDAKVPRAQRDTVPLVVDENDRIVWVAGHALDDEFRVTDAAQGVLLLRIRQV